MKTYLLLALLAIATISCKTESEENLMQEENLELSQQVAKASGIDEWNEVSKANFTFNVDRNGETVVSRAWEWEPKSDQVTLRANDTTITYNRNSIDSLNMGTDRSFINDVYWLLPQFKLVWDEGTQITYPDSTANMVRIKYTGNDGYTPGDQYDMDIDENMMITNWKYYPQGRTEPAMQTSFEDYQDYNGIKIATNHATPDGSTRIYFTDIKITK